MRGSTLVPPTHKTSWNLFPVLEGSCNCVATTSALGQGLPRCPRLHAQQCRAGCRTMEATQAPRQGGAWHNLIFLSKRWHFLSSTKAYLPPKLTLTLLSDLPHSRSCTTSSCTQPGSQPRSLKLLHFMGRNHPAPKAGHPF